MFIKPHDFATGLFVAFHALMARAGVHHLHGLSGQPRNEYRSYGEPPVKVHWASLEGHHMQSQRRPWENP